MEEANSSNHIINLKSSHFRGIVISSSLSQWHNPECEHMPLCAVCVCNRVQGLLPLFLSARKASRRTEGVIGALMWRQVVCTKFKLKATALFNQPSNFWGKTVYTLTPTFLQLSSVWNRAVTSFNLGGSCSSISGADFRSQMWPARRATSPVSPMSPAQPCPCHSAGAVVLQAEHAWELPTSTNTTCSLFERHILHWSMVIVGVFNSRNQFKK